MNLEPSDPTDNLPLTPSEGPSPDALQLPAQIPPQDPEAPSSTQTVISGELLPLALSVLRDIMVHGKSEKSRLDAANAVVDLAGLKARAPASGPSLTVNVPPEYLGKSLKALASLRLSHDEEPIDV